LQYKQIAKRLNDKILTHCNIEIHHTNASFLKFYYAELEMFLS